jgi:hypothetical protein
MKRFVPIACAALMLLGSQAAAADGVERRAVVPEPDRPHGEVRLVRRDGATVVQTLIHSRSVRRVAGAIADKERANWPTGSDGAADAARYIDALAAVSAAVRETAPAGRDRRRSLCIEFPAAGPVVVSAAVVENGEDGLRLVETVEPRDALDLGVTYVRRNRVLIVADAFGVDETTAASWLEAAPD